MNKQRVVRAALTAAALAAAAPLAGAATTWNFDTGCSGSNGASYGNTWTCGSGASQLTASAWSTATYYGGEGNFRDADLERYAGSGFGVKNREGNNGDGQSPEHAMDNERGTDLIALSFAQSVTLSSLSVGWWSDDSDLSVLAYTGTGAPSSLTDYSASTLLGAGSGWELVGNYANVGTGSEAINSGNISSSWWLISAYNTNFGSGSKLGQGNDYVKLLSVAGTPYKPPPPPPGVPEPGTLALAGVALLGAWRIRRGSRGPAA